MELSIIIPAYNAEPFLAKCLDSITKQLNKKTNVKIIIVNDGSTDGTLRIANQYAEVFSCIAVISQDNRGLSAARNAGILKAGGDYIWFIDSDDWISDSCLNKILNRINNENPDVLCLRAADVSKNGIVPRFKFDNLDDKTGKEALVNWKSPCAPFFVFKKNLLDDNQIFFYEGVYHEDTEFTPRVLYLANKVSFFEEIVYFVYENPGSITRSDNPKRVFDTLLVCRRLEDFMNKHVDNLDLQLFSKIISISINSSLYDAVYNMSRAVQIQFDECLYNEKSLFKHLWESKICKYRIEFFLFKIFPHSVTRVYSHLIKYSK